MVSRIMPQWWEWMYSLKVENISLCQFMPGKSLREFYLIKAATQYKDEEDWEVMDNSATFKFSLHPNDLVKISH